MRIAVDVRSLMEGRHSGVEEYTVQIIRHMVQAAPQHSFVLFYNSLLPVSLPVFEPAVEIRGFRFPNKLLNAGQFMLDWPRWDKLVKADCFFVTNPRILPVSPGVPYVVTAHDLSYELFPEFYSWRRRVWHKLMKPKHLMQNADHVIAVSRATRDDLVRLYGLKEERVSVVYSGVGVSDKNNLNNMRIKRLVTRGASQAGNKKLKDKLPKCFVLFLGTLEPRKNIVSLVEAYSAIAGTVEHDLVIAGSEGWLGGGLDLAIRRSKYHKRIHRIGFVSEEEKFEIYKRADLFVYPSFYEGFGFPPLEALLAGTPVVTSDNSALPEVVGEWAIMVNPYDVGELALVMKEVLKELSNVTPINKQAVLTKFSWDRAARETLKIIESVA